ncbi:hypothetical protein CHARACLAT_007896 [Characodon lateralis]|uniref:Uncharacterized protein n=1 Tax=Characodon lateralis TaxID=208331 RepID=A0ABU7CYP7_9TELE|nr:hypothetical protein [Characodon lateralis]
MNPLPIAQGHTPHVSSIPEKPTKPHPYSASFTHSPAPSTPPHPAPHHTAKCNGNASATRNATQLPPTGATGQTSLSTAPTMDRLTSHQDGTNSQRNHTNYITAIVTIAKGGNIIQLSSTIAVQPIQVLVTPHSRR